MTNNFDKFTVPVHLAGQLAAHAQTSSRLEIGGNDLTNLEITKLKKQKLAIRTAIIDRPLVLLDSPPVTDVTLHPLGVDTLQLLRQKLSSTILAKKARVGSTSTELHALETLHDKVLARLAVHGVHSTELLSEVQLEMPLAASG